MWCDIILAVLIIIFAIVGIVRGFVDSVLSIFSSLVSLVVSYFLAKYVATLLDNWFHVNKMFSNMLGSWGLGESVGGFSRENIASCITFLLSMLLVWIILKIVILLVSKLFSSVTANSSTLSTLNRVFGGVFGFVKGGLFVAIGLSVVSLLGTFNLGVMDEWIRNNTVVTKVIYKYLDPWVREHVSDMVHDWADKITDKDDDKKSSTNGAPMEETENVIVVSSTASDETFTYTIK